MPADTTIHSFPELRAYAESEARAHFEALREVARAMPGTLPKLAAGGGWEAPPPSLRVAWISAHLTLLCDLTRPASRYAVSVLVGNRIRWDGHSVALSVETGGINIHALFRDCGFKAEPSLNAGADLALIVRHLWPEESPDAR